MGIDLGVKDLAIAEFNGTKITYRNMLDATLQLSVVASNALTNGHNNGNVERARKAAKDAADAYENFMREVAATEISK